MGHGQTDNGHTNEVRATGPHGGNSHPEEFVLEKSIFNNVFEKDIRRVFVYKKAERLAKAIHLISPAFAGEASLKERLHAIAIGLIDAAIEPTAAARTALSRELLALSSVLALARTSNLLSPMNAELIRKEAHILLQEVALYEEPRLALDEVPTLSELAKDASSREATRVVNAPRLRATAPARPQARKGHIKDRSEAVLSVIRSKGEASIKDISTMVRGVSEKTIQRELASLVHAGTIMKQGERRWSTYSFIER